ncbi:DUF5721 family protein [Faecalimonas sp.]
MVLLSISEVKEFMSKLLLSETFDSFLFIEGEIVTFNTFSINGRLQKDFFDKDMLPERNYSLWTDLREYCFSLIRGKRTPLRFKFIFGLAETNIKKLLEQQTLAFTPQDVQGLYLNISYDGTSLKCVTGTSMNLFTLDKSLEEAWDKMIQKFFTQKKIEFELM